ncbi:hypothetical protein MKZ38_001431 [Zalerion maritima]|uniref:Zn(2)-C6 fungal-type domain-containing protein n=1 Tax=Zalerion maritima TaxID=339359 RepID=A0AAD5RRG0_9PEZI|nr:hypothetical protein MKZ38_001431 [Zalerion maritima]
MDQQGPDTKRPRLSTPGGSWTSLPLPPAPSYQPSATLPPSTYPSRTPPTPGPPLDDRRHHEPAGEQQQHYPSHPSSHPQPPPPSQQQHPAPQPHALHPQQQQHQQGPPPPQPPQQQGPPLGGPPPQMQQDHRQPPPSPAHPPPYSTYPQRDPMIKRDPGEDPLSRSMSTGAGPEGMPQTPHGLPQHHPEHNHPHPQQQGPPPRHVNFDGSHPHHPPPHMGPTPIFQHPGPPRPQGPPGPPSQGPSYPPTPIHAHPPQPFEQPVYQPPAHESIYGIPYTTTSNSKRKAQRASQACDSCRQLKAKCDEMKPCKSCREKSIECKYRETVPKAQDKIATDILDGINKLLSQNHKEFKSLAARISTLEKVMKNANIPFKAEHGDDDMEMKPPTSPLPEPHDSRSPGDMAYGVASEYDQDDRTGISEMEDEAALATVQKLDREEAMHERPGPYVEPGDPPFPPDHTTPAHKLLSWPPIDIMVRKHFEKENIRYLEEFPMRQEMQRGLLRIYGRGEGHDVEHAGIESAGGQLFTPMEMHDDVSEAASSPSPAADFWGQVGGLTPPATVEVKGSSVGSDGNPDYTPSTVWKYVASFEENIMNIHPLIPQRELHALVKRFLVTLPGGHNSTQKFDVPVAGFMESTTGRAGDKRKRSSPGPESMQIPRWIPHVRPGKPYRNVRNALVFMILALGKLSLHKTRIPDPVPEFEPHQSPSLKNGATVPMSPVQRSPPVFPGSHAPTSSALPSPKEVVDTGSIVMSRRSSFQGVAASAKHGLAFSIKKNYDVIPGLEYYALASDILGNQVGGNTLKHAWAYLLCGLYHGQLGRIHESWSYIYWASTSLYLVLLPKFARLRALHEKGEFPTEKRDNQELVAFWSCLQLESDILAELGGYPQSALLSFEDKLPYPRIALLLDVGFTERVTGSYVAQLFLRKHLNSLHKSLYDPKQPPPTLETIKDMEAALLSNRKWIPPEYRFDMNDAPAEELLSARLRAKFWGAQVITYRLFIKNILEHNFESMLQAQGHQSGDYGLVLTGDSRMFDLSNPVTMEKAVAGLNALKESTKAFWRLGAGDGTRIIITNAFGTAHAQWGNLLTLAAAYRDPMLGQFLVLDEMKLLFAKTVRFIELNAAASSALAVDARLLRGLGKDVLGMTEHDFAYLTDSMNPGSSFSGSTPSGAPVAPSVSSPTTLGMSMEPISALIPAPNQFPG